MIMSNANAITHLRMENDALQGSVKCFVKNSTYQTEKGLGTGVVIRLFEPTKFSKKARGKEHLGRR